MGVRFYNELMNDSSICFKKVKNFGTVVNSVIF